MKFFISTMVFCLFFSGCALPKFYKQIKKSNLDETYYNKFDKAILEKFEMISPVTDHLCYIYVTDDDINSYKFSGLVYDFDNNKYYKIENDSGKPNDSYIIKLDGISKNEYGGFLLSNYLEGNINHLVWLAKIFPIHGTTSYDIINDIDIINNQYLRFKLSKIIIDDHGVPFLDTPEGKVELKKYSAPNP